MKIALTIAGSDSGGGAGMQADLKTFHQYGVFGTCAVVAVTAQNTCGVRSVHPIPNAVVAAQLTALAADLPPAAVKTGMLATAGLVELVARAIADQGWTQYVCDPVMVATSRDRLLDPEAETVVRDRLLPLARIVTPNLDEAEILTGLVVRDPVGMERAGRRLLGLGARAALVKGGHLATEVMTDVLVTPLGVHRFTHPRLVTTSTHGTGCTLSAAITAGLALGHELPESVAAALDYVHRAIQEAPRLGTGHGPLNHMVPAPNPASVWREVPGDRA
jgi:hydroxymethylpyrimidine kinase/phosphomethylpyrimidine kinase